MSALGQPKIGLKAGVSSGPSRGGHAFVWRGPSRDESVGCFERVAQGREARIAAFRKRGHHPQFEIEDKGTRRDVGLAESWTA